MGLFDSILDTAASAIGGSGKKSSAKSGGKEKKGAGLLSGAGIGGLIGGVIGNKELGGKLGGIAGGLVSKVLPTEKLKDISEPMSALDEIKNQQGLLIGAHDAMEKEVGMESEEKEAEAADGGLQKESEEEAQKEAEQEVGEKEEVIEESPAETQKTVKERAIQQKRELAQRKREEEVKRREQMARQRAEERQRRQQELHEKRVQTQGVKVDRQQSLTSGSENMAKSRASTPSVSSHVSSEAAKPEAPVADMGALEYAAIGIGGAATLTALGATYFKNRGDKADVKLSDEEKEQVNVSEDLREELKERQEIEDLAKMIQKNEKDRLAYIKEKEDIKKATKDRKMTLDEGFRLMELRKLITKAVNDKEVLDETYETYIKYKYKDHEASAKNYQKYRTFGTVLQKIPTLQGEAKFTGPGVKSYGKIALEGLGLTNSILGLGDAVNKKDAVENGRQEAVDGEERKILKSVLKGGVALKKGISGILAIKDLVKGVSKKMFTTINGWSSFMGSLTGIVAGASGVMGAVSQGYSQANEKSPAEVKGINKVIGYLLLTFSGIANTLKMIKNMITNKKLEAHRKKGAEKKAYQDKLGTNTTGMVMTGMQIVSAVSGLAKMASVDIGGLSGNDKLDKSSAFLNWGIANESMMAANAATGFVDTAIKESGGLDSRKKAAKQMFLRLQNLSTKAEGNKSLGDALVNLGDNNYGEEPERISEDYCLARRYKADIDEMNTELFDGAGVSGKSVEEMKTKEEFLKALVGGMNTMF